MKKLEEISSTRITIIPNGNDLAVNQFLKKSETLYAPCNISDNSKLSFNFDIPHLESNKKLDVFMDEGVNPEIHFQFWFFKPKQNITLIKSTTKNEYTWNKSRATLIFIDNIDALNCLTNTTADEIYITATNNKLYTSSISNVKHMSLIELDYQKSTTCVIEQFLVYLSNFVTLKYEKMLLSCINYLENNLVEPVLLDEINIGIEDITPKYMKLRILEILSIVCLLQRKMKAFNRYFEELTVVSKGMKKAAARDIFFILSFHKFKNYILEEATEQLKLDTVRVFLKQAHTFSFTLLEDGVAEKKVQHLEYYLSFLCFLFSFQKAECLLKEEVLLKLNSLCFSSKINSSFDTRCQSKFFRYAANLYDGLGFQRVSMTLRLKSKENITQELIESPYLSTAMKESALKNIFENAVSEKRMEEAVYIFHKLLHSKSLTQVELNEEKEKLELNDETTNTNTSLSVIRVDGVGLNSVSNKGCWKFVENGSEWKPLQKNTFYYFKSVEAMVEITLFNGANLEVQLKDFSIHDESKKNLKSIVSEVRILPKSMNVVNVFLREQESATSIISKYSFRLYGINFLLPMSKPICLHVLPELSLCKNILGSFSIKEEATCALVSFAIVSSRDYELAVVEADNFVLQKNKLVFEIPKSDIWNEKIGSTKREVFFVHFNKMQQPIGYSKSWISFMLDSTEVQNKELPLDSETDTTKSRNQLQENSNHEIYISSFKNMHIPISAKFHKVEGTRVLELTNESSTDVLRDLAILIHPTNRQYSQELLWSDLKPLESVSFPLEQSNKFNLVILERGQLRRSAYNISLS
eukprot:snap_masked-scaffold_2-processed-gene-8.10-mRNA-1 protein AED:1.00 eAED:1.00 QI:0/0/0/0/1/1/2/0/809